MPVSRSRRAERLLFDPFVTPNPLAEKIDVDFILHYDTFPPIKLDHAAARQTAKACGKELLLLKIGETTDA